MEIKLAKTAGFCFGVERAVDLTLKTLEKEEKVYTWGPVVHNEAVIGDLKEKGAVVFDPKDDIDTIPEGSAVVLRAHGVTRALEESLQIRGLKVVDAVCPFVKKIHLIVKKHSEDGEFIVITGDENHPEVQGIIGWVNGDYAVIVSEEEEELKKIPEDRKICLVSQTTFQLNKFKKIVAKIKEKNYNAYIADTVCSATRERQEESAAIAREADVMLVIGSKTSSNSQKLYHICKEQCSHTYFIQSQEDLKQSWFLDVKCVGITAGASTPKKIFKEVQNHVREF